MNTKNKYKAIWALPVAGDNNLISNKIKCLIIEDDKFIVGIEPHDIDEFDDIELKSILQNFNSSCIKLNFNKSEWLVMKEFNPLCKEVEFIMSMINEIKYIFNNDNLSSVIPSIDKNRPHISRNKCNESVIIGNECYTLKVKLGWVDRVGKKDDAVRFARFLESRIDVLDLLEVTCCYSFCEEFHELTFKLS